MKEDILKADLIATFKKYGADNELIDDMLSEGLQPFLAVAIMEYCDGCVSVREKIGEYAERIDVPISTLVYHYYVPPMRGSQLVETPEYRYLLAQLEGRFPCPSMWRKVLAMVFKPIRIMVVRWLLVRQHEEGLKTMTEIEENTGIARNALYKLRLKVWEQHGMNMESYESHIRQRREESRRTRRRQSTGI